MLKPVLDPPLGLQFSSPLMLAQQFSHLLPHSSRLYSPPGVRERKMKHCNELAILIVFNVYHVDVGFLAPLMSVRFVPKLTSSCLIGIPGASTRLKLTCSPRSHVITLGQGPAPCTFHVALHGLMRPFNITVQRNMIDCRGCKHEAQMYIDTLMWCERKPESGPRSREANVS